MDLLRPPPGSEHQDEAPPPKRRFLHFFFAVLFLAVGMVIFFVGGVIVRNPELPNYLLDQIVTRVRGNTSTGKAYVSSAENLKPPPPPTTVNEYFNLMSYDENTLPPDERAVASVLNETANSLNKANFVRATARLPVLYNEKIAPGLRNLQPGGDVTEIRGAVAECQESATITIKFFQELSEQLAAKLIAAGVPGSLAHQTAETFAERVQARRNISYAANVNLVCKDVTTVVDLLSKNPTKWKRDSNGNILFTSKAMIELYNAAVVDENSAVKALNGG